ncbi:hypothetical protein ROG8370_03773 [Roseovarius gaetbuli]|uniref:DUF2125 domain-containing protein n=1 Tax=Roseovarius gaetbuli TaxID=1356575 RepID=A0A1X7AC89_9RHOB|nr:DUF2125 domain-containing protein [Roseovarius gaetbuli]SLN75362.1 hypothetical protein ROG8370_03773 [Roseovarius gaetbuli]
MATLRSLFASATLVSFALSGTAALADVTADQVWQDWKAYLTTFGYEVTGDEQQSGNTLAISNIAMTVIVPDTPGFASLRMNRMDLVENGDGTVSVVLPATTPMALVTEVEPGKTATATMEIAQSGLVMTVSGTPEAMQYVYDAEEISLGLSTLDVDGEAVDIGAASVALANVKGSSQSVDAGGIRDVRQKMTAGPVTYELDFTDPTEGGHLAMTGAIAAAAFDGDVSLPPMIDNTDMVASLEAGFRFDSGMTYENASVAYRIEGDGETIEGTSTSAGGGLRSVFGPDGLEYEAEGRDINIAMTGSDLPFPVTFGMARSGFDMKVPVAQGEEVQDFALAVEFGDFTLSDMIWSLFDPAGQLPRDPATIAFDLTGKGRLFVDLMDPEQMEDLGTSGDTPGELESLSLNSLTVAAAGATLTGDGAFTFDNSDLTSFDGVPAPEGAVDLKLVGGNGLLDRLIAMGFVPQDQAMVARMMVGMFAVVGEGEDTLNSKIEVNDQGHVLANGQRLR